MNQKMVRLSNNQSHELKLFEILMTRVGELEKLKGTGDLNLDDDLWGIHLTVEEESQFEVNYTVQIFAHQIPLRVIISKMNEIEKPKSFKETRALLQRLIADVEGKICWAKRDEDKWNQIAEEFDPERLEDDDKPEGEEFTEVNVGDGPGGLKIYE